MIAALLTPADRRAAVALGLPVVTIAGALADPGVPRGEGFAARLAELGRAAPAIHLSRGALGRHRPWLDATRHLDAWVASIGAGAGVFAANDTRARMVVESCDRLGLRVPDDVGVLGVDDDPVTCDFTVPPLSSIRCDWYQIGTRAAERLGGLMSGGGRGGMGDVLVPPVGVVGRASTDVLVVDHPAVAAVVRYVREHAAEPFGIKAVVGAADVSRRSLEMAFRKLLACTPAEFVARERVRRARAMMERNPSAELSAVARACGFADERRFRLVFQRQAGVTPAAFRRRMKG